MRPVLFNEQGLKLCTKCKQMLPKESFPKGTKYRSGYASSCKMCKRKAAQDNAESISAKHKEYYLRNKERISAYAKEYRKQNAEALKIAFHDKYIKSRDKIIARVSEYYKKNPEVNRVASKKYRDATPAKQAAKAARYRARKRKAMPEWAYDEFEQLFISEIYDLARLRSKMLGIDYHVDHIVPIKSSLVCGLHCSDNLQILSGKENSAKRNLYWPDMP